METVRLSWRSGISNMQNNHKNSSSKLLQIYKTRWQAAEWIARHLCPEPRGLRERLAIAIFEHMNLNDVKLDVEGSGGFVGEIKVVKSVELKEKNGRVLGVLELYEDGLIVIKPNVKARADDRAITWLKEKVLEAVKTKHGGEYSLPVDAQGFLDHVELKGFPTDDKHLQEIGNAAKWAFKTAAERPSKADNGGRH